MPKKEKTKMDQILNPKSFTITQTQKYHHSSISR